MRWANLFLALLATAVSSVSALSLAEKGTQAPETLDQSRREVKANGGHTLESIREEVKRSQVETDARISTTLIEPLRQRITSLEEKANNTAPWWFVVVTTLLGAVVSFIASLALGRIAAHRDWGRAANERIFARARFPSLKDSLLSNLREQIHETDMAEIALGNLMKSPLVKPGEPSEGFTIEGFDECAYIEGARALKVNTFELNFPEEGKRRTKALAKLFRQHQSQTQNLNGCLHAFFVLLRSLSVYENPDEQILTKYGANSIRTLKHSEHYQRDLETARNAISTAASEFKSSACKLENELETIEKILGDVSPPS